MTNNVVSFSDLKARKDKQNMERLITPSYDFYIPYEEIPFWERVGEYIQSKEAAAILEGVNNKVLVDEFVSAFAVDIEMYKEFGTQLEKFRFIFNYLELHVLYKVIVQIKNTSTTEQVEMYETEMEHYLNFLAKQLKENNTLESLIYA